MTNMDFGLFEDSYKSYCPGSNDKHSFETPENSPQNHIAAVYMTNAAFRFLMISAACTIVMVKLPCGPLTPAQVENGMITESQCNTESCDN